MFSLVPAQSVAQWEPHDLPNQDSLHWKTGREFWGLGQRGAQTQSINPAKHQWESVHIQAGPFPQEIAMEWTWSVPFSSNNYLQVGWRKGLQEQYFQLGGTLDRLEFWNSDSLLNWGLENYASSSYHMVLLLTQDSIGLEAKVVIDGTVRECLHSKTLSLESDTLFVRIGQSGSSAIQKHELMGFYRGLPLDWGWHNQGSDARLAFTELSLSAAAFGGESFLELYNAGTRATNLMGCTLLDPKSQKKAPQSYILRPGERVCLSKGRSQTNLPYQQWPQMPHLNQDGDTLWFKNPLDLTLARTAYRQAQWQLYKPEWGYHLEKACEQWACRDEFNWTPSPWPGGSPGMATSEPCLLDSNLLFDRLPLCVQSQNELLIREPPHAWANWDSVFVGKTKKATNATGLTRFPLPPTPAEVSVLTCSGKTQHVSHNVQPLARSGHLFMTEALLGPKGSGQSFVEFFNPSDSCQDLGLFRLEFRNELGHLTQTIPLGSTLVYAGANSVVLLAEDLVHLSLTDTVKLGIWHQLWAEWPSGYQPCQVYLCSAQLILDSLVWQTEYASTGHSTQRYWKGSAWQENAKPQPGIFLQRQPVYLSKPQLSNTALSSSQPTAEIHCYSAQAVLRMGVLFQAQGIPMRVLFNQRCPAGNFYYSLNRDDLPAWSHACILIYEQGQQTRNKYSLRISRLD